MNHLVRNSCCLKAWKDPEWKSDSTIGLRSRGCRPMAQPVWKKSGKSYGDLDNRTLPGIGRDMFKEIFSVI